MQKITKLLPRVLARASDAHTREAFRTSRFAEPKNRRGGNDPPELCNRECDIEIPERLFSAWAPMFGTRKIVRALTDIERAKISGRADALGDALLPFTSDQERLVE